MIHARCISILAFVAGTAFPVCGVEAEIELSKVMGKVVVDGQPLDGGRVFFHLDDGQFIGSHTKKDGSFKVDRVPLGTKIVTFDNTLEGKPLPRKFRSVKTSGLRVEVARGNNRFEFALETD